ncbi:Armadillo [Macleaya cordata]|uniref:Kinesin-like protein n=1 Tax=Macleaya cordata TaxID=56857 RepID=A0A200R5L8_MACCD|nr:Armadillo [Macleaya cordata]
MASNSGTKSSHRNSNSDRQVPHSSSSSSSAARSSNGHPPLRSKPNSARRSVTPTSRASSNNNDDSEPARVRVAVRVRPRDAEDLNSEADYADCIELQPELKRLKLRKNNWNSESYKFDEVFTESASQRRVYEVVAKPVVESVLNGYNGTVMAYGQTGTGKTYTVGRLGKHDPSERGIMVRALEDILANTSPGLDTVEVSYLQLYLESIQDLLAPEKNNIPIVEDSKTGEVSLPGAAVVKVRDIDQFMQLVQIGEVNRHAANTKMNTESSRSHAILMVYIQRTSQRKVENEVSTQERDTRHNIGNGINTLHKSKLLIVDLAGSERIDKSGHEGHMLEETKFINLSLTSLGKCINALAENSPHIPTRDSKLTRMLRDSFGGSARTSLIITIGPSARHHAETSSTIMFGQRAMKIVNMMKLKVEFDYESLCRKLENQVDYLIAENERQQKLREDDKDEMEKKLIEYKNSFAEVEKSLDKRCQLFEKENNRLVSENKKILDELKLQKDRNDVMHDQVARLEMNLKQSKQQQLEGSSYQKVLADTTQMYEKKIAELVEKIEDEHARFERAEEQLAVVKQILSDHQKSTEGQEEIDDLRIKLQRMCQLHEKTVNDFQSLKTENVELLSEKAMLSEELHKLTQKLSVEEKQRKYIEDEVAKLKKLVSENVNDTEVGCLISLLSIKFSKRAFHISLCFNNLQERSSIMKENIGKVLPGLGNSMIGLEKIIAMLKSQDLDVQIHAVKAVANLAAEDSNQEKIVEEGGLDALLMLLGSSENTTIHRVASGAIANLAMSERNQTLIMSKGGAHLLANIASKTDDPQTLRMVAGAIANLCGNQKLHVTLKEDGAIKALLGMGRSGNSDVIAQIARGMANFAKCESRGTVQGYRKGPSLLLEDGALAWLIANCSITSASTRRHIELALCHLAQNDDNAPAFVTSGAVKELVRVSSESTREDIRTLAKKTLKLNPVFQAEIQTL